MCLSFGEKILGLYSKKDRIEVTLLFAGANFHFFAQVQHFVVSRVFVAFNVVEHTRASILFCKRLEVVSPVLSGQTNRAVKNSEKKVVLSCHVGHF